MNKLIRTGLLGCCLLFSSFLFADDSESAYLQQINAAAAQELAPAIAQRKQQEALEASQLQQTEDGIQAGLVQARLQQQTPAVPTAQPQATSPTPPDYTNTKVTCDCYNNSDSNNLSADNFLYNQNGQRIFRKNPSCQCLTQKSTAHPSSNSNISSVINPIASTPVTSSPQGSNSQQNSTTKSSPTNPLDFGIKY